MTGRIGIALLGAAALAVPAGAQNLLTNGGFEGETFATGQTYKDYAAGQTIGGGGWTVLGTPGVFNAINSLSGAYAEQDLGFPPQAGNNALDLTGGGNQGPLSGVVQTVSTVAGQVYDLSFYLGNAATTVGSGRAGAYSQASSLTLSIGGGTAVTYTNADVTFGSINWRQFTTSFVGSGNPTTIQFNNATPTGDNYAGLDTVSLVQGVAAVPEPATWATMLLGFGLTGFGMRRRQALVSA